MVRRRKYYVMTQGLSGIHEELYTPIIHEAGAHDEIIAVERRILPFIDAFRVNRVVLRQFQLEAKILATKMGRKITEPYTEQQVLDHYSGRLRARYEAAYESLKTNEFSKVDAWVSGFVKREKYTEEDFEEKAPRLIMPRDPRFGALMAKYTKPVEAVFFHLVDQYKLPYFAKYYDPTKRASIILAKMEQFTRPGMSVIDAKKFDAHVNISQLRAEHTVYKRIFKSRTLQQLCDLQLHNVIRTDGGIVIRIPGCRMSGDMNTSLGNCMIVHMGLNIVKREVPTLTWFDDGDDCILFYEIGDRLRVAAITERVFRGLGHELVTLHYDDISDLTFCQQKICCGRMVRPWQKIISTCFVSYKHYHSLPFGYRVMKTIAQAELALNVGIPILQPYFQAWINKLTAFEMVDVKFLDESLLRRVHQGFNSVTPQQITESSRVEFWERFNITPIEQLDLERKLVAYVEDYALTGWNVREGTGFGGVVPPKAGHR